MCLLYVHAARRKKLALLRRARCLLYTPSREHFGIVPIEAMYMECPRRCGE
jgi:alpha-1,3/alpha-1,6-mannosyltransferase